MDGLMRFHIDSGLISTISTIEVVVVVDVLVR